MARVALEDDVLRAAAYVEHAGERINLARVQHTLRAVLNVTVDDGEVIDALDALENRVPPRLKRTGLSWTIGSNDRTGPVYRIVPTADND